MKNLVVVLLFALAVITLSSQARAAVTLPAVISSGAVLQRQMPIPFWGWDEPGQEVTVTLDGQTQSTKADDKGFWMVKFPAREAGGPYALTIKGSTNAELNDILVGEVWFCSGQSNMAWKMKDTSNIKEEKAIARFPNLRTLNFPVNNFRRPNPLHGASKYPLKDGKLSGPAWTASSPETIEEFSGVAYFFAKNIQTDLNVPIGIINSSLGGSRIQAWLSAGGSEFSPVFKEDLQREKIAIETYDREMEEYNKKNPKGKKPAPAASQPAATQPPARQPIPGTRLTAGSPSALFNAMVVPVAPYAIRGVLWYQGEANAGKPETYQSYLSALIRDWRVVWGQGDFPFIVVQLPNYKEESWPYLREAQYLAVKETPNAQIAVTIDIGARGIHPTNKRPCGDRLALIALESVYKKEVSSKSPIFAFAKIEGEKAIVKFANASKGLVTKDGKPPALFELAGPDGVYARAAAQIESDTVILTSDKVKNPQTVRFAWSAMAEGFNLYNKEGLPAMPFRTDQEPAPSKKAPTEP